MKLQAPPGAAMSSGSAATNPDLATAVTSAIVAPVQKGIELEDGPGEIEVANAFTHNKEYKAFMRKKNSGNPAKFPEELLPKFKENRQQLFTDWLNNNQSFAQVRLFYKRKNVSSCTQIDNACDCFLEPNVFKRSGSRV